MNFLKETGYALYMRRISTVQSTSGQIEYRENMLFLIITNTEMNVNEIFFIFNCSVHESPKNLSLRLHLEIHLFPCHGMEKGKGNSAQRKRIIFRNISICFLEILCKSFPFFIVFPVTEKRDPRMGHLYADLVKTSCLKVNFCKKELPIFTLAKDPE